MLPSKGRCKEGASQTSKCAADDHIGVAHHVDIDAHGICSAGVFADGKPLEFNIRAAKSVMGIGRDGFVFRQDGGPAAHGGKLAGPKHRLFALWPLFFFLEANEYYSL